jgi:uncharacterized membrane protein (DUF4010 family)
MSGTLDFTAAWNFAMALLIGALIGVDREKQKASSQHRGLGGIRTFILLALAGAVSAWLSQRLDSPWIFALTLLVVSAIVIAGYVMESRSGSEDLGLTTEVAALVTVLLGGACLAGSSALAVALGIVTSAVLAYKQPLHAFIGRIARDDIYAALKLLIATFIVLPLLPKRALDPWGALNPSKLWLLVILISFLSLIGYVAVRSVGPRRGTALTGLFGGLVSSTAVTLTFAKQSRSTGSASTVDRALAVGLMLAWATMFVRVIVTVAIVYAPLAVRVVEPLLAMGVTALAAAAVLYRLSGRHDAPDGADAVEVPVTNPFSLTSASKFALLFAAVMLAVKLAEHYLPGRGLYLVAALAGLTDVDAITLSMASLARDGGDPAPAAASIVIATLTNTIVKCGMVMGLGAGAFRRATLAVTVLIVAAGGALMLLR